MFSACLEVEKRPFNLNSQAPELDMALRSGALKTICSANETLRDVEVAGFRSCGVDQVILLVSKSITRPTTTAAARVVALLAIGVTLVLFSTITFTR